MSVFNRRSLLRAVQLAASITPRNTPKACLQGVKITGTRDCLEVTGTDLETVAITATVSGDGCDLEACLPQAIRLVSVLSECTDDEITLTKEGDSLVIRGQFSETLLQDCDNPDSYPTPPVIEPDNTLLIPVGTLSTVLKRIVFCAASESARYALTGVRIEPQDGKAVFVATDGKRLATEEIDCPSSLRDTGDFIVPEKAIKLILSSCRGEDGEASLGLTKNYAKINVDGVTITARLLEGRYPTWREVFPKKYDWQLPLMAGPMLNVTRQAAVMCTEDTRGISYTFSKGVLSAKSKSETGKARIELPVSYDGSEVSVDIAGDLMAEMLAQWPGDTDFTMKGVKNNTISLFEFPGTYKSIIVPLAKAVT